MQARRLLSTLFATAMLSTSCAALSTPGAVKPPPPPVDDTINTEAAFPDDGLTRLIVTPIAGAPASGNNSESDGPAPARGVAPVPVDPSRVLTPEMLAVMPPGAALEARDGQVGYIDADGTFVALEVSTLPVAPAPVAEPEVDEPIAEIVSLYGNPHIDALAADPAVESIIVVGDGTYAVETSDPTVIDPRVFSSVEDVAFGVTTDQYETYQWGLENDGTNLDGVALINQTEDADLDVLPTVDRADGQGIVIAVIDSGVDFSHPDLQNSAWSNLGEICGNGIDDDGNGFVDDCNGWDFANNDASPFNVGADSHGTHVAGIITANRNGVGVAGIAPDARVMDLNVGKGPAGSMSISGAWVTAAIRYAVDNGAHIINLSLGSQPGTPAASVASMGAAIDYAASKGVLVVAAAGNNNVDLASLPVYPASFNRPNMLVVGASTPSDTRAGFSNYGAAIVDVYAPGVLMLSTIPGDDYRFMSGTSQASPATAAAAALVMQMNPDVSMDLIIDAVTSTVDRKDALSTSTVSGRVNAAAAIGEGESPPIPTELEVLVSGLLSPSNEVAADVEIITPPEVFDEDYRWELSLLSTTNNGVYAIIDHPVLVDGVEAVTGANGALVLASAGATSVAVATNLPAGRYSFIIEAVPVADASFRLGEAFVATFEIAADDFDGTPPTTVEVEQPATTLAPNPGGEDPTGEGAPTTTVGGGQTEATDGNGTTPVDGGSAGGGSATSTTTPASGAPSTTAAPTGGGSNTDAPTSDQSTTTAPTGSPTTSGPNTTVSSGGTPTTNSSGSTGGNTGGGTGETPSTTSPGGSTPTTAAPVNTVPTGPAPAPDGLGTGIAKKGAWESTSVSPQAGYVNQANTVVIRGNFPSDTYVWFGGQAGQVVHQSRDSITVRTPLRATAGIVDITLQKSRNGVVLEIPDAFAFVAVTPGDGSSTDDSTGGGGATDGGGSTDDGSASDSVGGGGSTDDSTGGDSTDGGGSTDDTTTDTTPVSNRRARMIVGSAVELGNGLLGASVTPNVAAGAPLCNNDPCAAVRR